jgi:radical SAM superfamily enzyme YgiQ (UPF0313 family)
MNILHVFPTYPDTFWSFKHALKFISKRAGFPPLGTLTVAAMLPEEWNQRFVDMNAAQLKDQDLLWADYVFISAMSIQRSSAERIIARCKLLGKKIVAGGPLFTAHADDFEMVDHLVLNEAEITLPPFIEDIRKGQARHLYTSKEWADITTTPIPRWNLATLRHYSSMDIQYSRGCPYDCEFCDITVLYGREPRTKTKDQIIAELESLYIAGWKGNIFIVDDNFIGNKNKLKKEILPAIIDWMQAKNYPFTFTTEASINLSDDEALMAMMVEAGFDDVFVGIESPNAESLVECKKIPNKNRDLLASVKRIQRAGLCVNAGFILGFDSDPAEIFERLSNFIKESGIVTAMVGLLNAPRGTKLYERLKKEGRILKTFSGDNTNFSLNFIPRMNPEVLINGYKEVLKSIYSPKQYYARVKHFLRDFNPTQTKAFRLQMSHIKALIKSMVRLGIVGKERYQYWKLFVWMLFRRPKLFPMAITFAIYGFHFRKLFEQGLEEMPGRTLPIAG